VSSSRLPGLYKKPPAERLQDVAALTGLTAEEQRLLAAGVPVSTVDPLVENVVGVLPLPLGVATNFVVNGEEVIVPMAVEESSVVAAASHAAKMARAFGGFHASADPPLMIGQMAFRGVSDPAAARRKILMNRDRLIDLLKDPESGIVKRGGGPRDLEVREVPTDAGDLLVVHLVMDVRDAMGANAINTAVETLAPVLAEMIGGEPLMRILSNLADRRLARAQALFPHEELGGREVAERMVAAWAFADADPYRAATHNKGIMNGLDAVVVATGNDWRAVEAGAHAYAARTGRYRSLSRFQLTPEGHLHAELELPLALGVVGGATKAHPTAAAALRILGNPSASRLAEVAVSVALAQNVAAVRALVSEGIQAGHMRLHAKNLALMAGAPAHLLDRVAEQLVAEGKVRMSRAEEIVKSLRATGA